MITFKFFLLSYALVLTIAFVIFEINTKYFKNFFHKQTQGGDVEIIPAKELDALYSALYESRRSRSEWRLGEIAISAVAACAILLLSAWKLLRCASAHEIKIEQKIKDFVANQLETNLDEFKKELLSIIYKSASDLESKDIKEETKEVSNNNKKIAQTEVENISTYGVQGNLTCFKTSQVNYFPDINQEYHINEEVENIFSCDLRDNFTPTVIHAAKPVIQVKMLERKIAGSDIDYCDSEMLEDGGDVEFSNLGIDAFKGSVSYTILFRDDESCYETPERPCRITEISETIVDDHLVSSDDISAHTLSNECSKETLESTIQANEMPSMVVKGDNCSSTTPEETKLYDSASTADISLDLENDSYQTSDKDTESTTNSEKKSLSSVKPRIANKTNDEYVCDDISLACPINKSEETNYAKCISGGKDALSKTTEAIKEKEGKTFGPGRRIPQYLGLKKDAKKRDNVERIGSLTSLSHSKAESTASRNGAPRHQYSSGVRPETADSPVLRANNRNRKLRNKSGVN